MRSSARPLPTFVLVLIATLVAGCGGGTADAGATSREWRGLDLVVPSGWTVLLQRDDLLMVANEDIRVDDIDAPPSFPEDRNSNDVVAVQFSADDATGPGDWRALVEQEGGELEADEQITVGGLPATSLTYRWASNGVPSRERVVFVPSRQLYLLLQPVPIDGQTNGPEVYDRHTDEFEQIIDSIAFGRPFEG